MTRLVGLKTGICKVANPIEGPFSVEIKVVRTGTEVFERITL